ncbi:cysteine desulfurase family protein [Chryseobacterium wangxinyae]|uniref:cysteine desulfurase family protein n=1 Tax=Chryseobacterium sp. CY353 TaxID=2997334 RepID=UPI002271D1A5|nr:cysteine desulfurase family protein [Chryseobacterium sp. CY353]MCY0970139.1 cysteine desulfurase family protein [Chryseobacterium sp. CY353]
MADDYIYLDNNATTKTDPGVLASMMPYFTDYYANANSSHISGISLTEAVEDATWQIADLIGANEKEIIFTSGATEAINLAIKGLANSNKNKIITFTTEHKAVLETCKYMESKGFNVEYLPVQSDSTIDDDLLKNSITEDTYLVIAMMCNNETGTLHDIKKISEFAHQKGALLLCDTTQAVGKIPIDVSDLGIDMMTISAHKFYGPKGIGALYVSRNVISELNTQMHGGGQQKNLRSGTLNVPGVIGMSKACEIAKAEMKRDEIRIRKIRDFLEMELLKIDGSFVNGSVENRIYNTSNICFPGVWSEQLILSLGKILVSSGSACSAVTSEPSHVLKALGLSDEDALCSIRFSLGRFTTEDEINYTITRVKELIRQFKA